LYPQLVLHFGWEFLTIYLNYSWSDFFWRSYCPFTLKIFHQKVFFYIQVLKFRWEFLKTWHACLLLYKTSSTHIKYCPCL
jgi:hypothetical protein